MSWYQFWSLLALCINVFGKSTVEPAEKTPYQLKEFVEKAFQMETFNGSWISGNSFQFVDSKGDFSIFNVETRITTKFLDKKVTANYTRHAIGVSKDRKYVLIRHNTTPLYRSSTTAQFAIYDIETKKHYDLANKSIIQTAHWAPVGHGLVYVMDNNIYYLDNPTKVDSAIPITTDGIPGVIYNGAGDWSYEEMVLQKMVAYKFSPDGTRLAFIKINDTAVEEVVYQVYGRPGNMSNPYPKVHRLKYPRPGTPIPEVKAFVAELRSGQLEELPVVIPERFPPDGYILWRLLWITKSELSVVVMNRIQNEAELIRCDLKGTCRSEAAYKEEKGWLHGKNLVPTYNKAGTKRIQILAQPENDGGEEDHYMHLVLTDVESKKSRRLTRGKFEVMNILHWDEKKNFVYFTGSGREGKYTQGHAYVVHVGTSELQCLTCDPVRQNRPCLDGSVSLSTDLSYYVKTCSGPDPHFIQIVKSPDFEANRVLVMQPAMVWEDNQALMEKWARKLHPIVRDFRVPIANTKYEAYVRLMLPPNFNENSKYPALVYAYGGPSSGQIRETYQLYTQIEQYYTTNRNYVYILIDGRGIGRCGNKRQFEMYRRLGTVEMEDQITVMKYIQENYKFIDANRTGVWGWSYGGYAAGWIMAKDKENIFKFGVDVGGVSNMIYYNALHVEQHMGMPTADDNLAGYEAQDLPRHAEALRGKKFLLIHSPADDNVHFQHAMMLSGALQRADIPFEQQIYPDQNHLLPHVKWHFYHTMDRFFAKSMDLPDRPVSGTMPDPPVTNTLSDPSVASTVAEKKYERPRSTKGSVSSRVQPTSGANIAGSIPALLWLLVGQILTSSLVLKLVVSLWK